MISDIQDYSVNDELGDHSVSNDDNSKTILNTAYYSKNKLTPVSKMSTLSSNIITEDKTRSSIQMVNKNYFFL